MERRGEKLKVCSCLSLTYISCQYFQNFAHQEDINNWYLTATHYAKCYAISGQNKKLKLKYLINKTLERKNTKELILQFQTFFHITQQIFLFHKHFNN